MHTAKIQREMLKGMVGLICPAHRENASRLTAVKMSTPYTARETKRKNQRKK